MKSKLKDGKILEDMFWQLKKTVKKMIFSVEKDKDKRYFNGPITRLFNFSLKIDPIF